AGAARARTPATSRAAGPATSAATTPASAPAAGTAAPAPSDGSPRGGRGPFPPGPARPPPPAATGCAGVSQRGAGASASTPPRFVIPPSRLVPGQRRNGVTRGIVRLRAGERLERLPCPGLRHPEPGRRTMPKLTLKVEELVVDSFATAPSNEGLMTTGGGCGWSDDSVCPTVSGRCCPP